MRLARVPVLRNPDTVIRVAANRREIAAANRLVFENYVADGFWSNDEQELATNRFMHTPNRDVFVALQEDQLIGTLSIIRDSPIGLPSDGGQADLMRKIRKTGANIAEVSALAMRRPRTSRSKLVLFLISYMLQYSFYYAGLDRLVASCKPEHADFYESVLSFSKISGLTYYSYSRASGYLISLDLLQAHSLLSEKYPPDPVTGDSLYRFLLCDPQPCQRFAPSERLRRRRGLDWTAHAARKVA